MIRAQVRLTELRPPPEDETWPFSRYVDDEIAAMLGQSPRTAANRLSTYWDIAERLPAALEAMAAGTLDYPRLLALAQATAPLSRSRRPRWSGRCWPAGGWRRRRRGGAGLPGW